MELQHTPLTGTLEGRESVLHSPHFGRIEQSIVAWLQAKSERSGSLRTGATYATVLSKFRALVQSGGYDLFADCGFIASLAQGWASKRKSHPRHHLQDRPLTPATYNHTLAVLSSYYAYAIKHGFWEGANPIDLIERRTVTSYAKAQALDEHHVVAAIRAIGNTSLKDYRDFALLTLAFSTGRRVTELASMTIGSFAWKQIKTAKQSRRALTITFHAKGGKILVDALEPDIELALVSYLSVLYGASWHAESSTAPIWVSCSRNPAIHGQPLRPVGITYIFKQHLGQDTHPHQARHSFSVTMDEVRAPLSEIQRRLGHANIAVTSRYMAQLRTEENPYGADVVRRLGLHRTGSGNENEQSNRITEQSILSPRLEQDSLSGFPISDKEQDETSSPSLLAPRVQSFASLIEQVQLCQQCPRMEGRARVFGKGNGNPESRILFLAEAPGRLGADRWQIPLYGDQTGRNFEQLLAAAGLTREQIFISNAVLCNPRDDDGNNAVPAKSELHNCSKHLRSTLDMLQPRYIVSLGKTALAALNLIAPHSIELATDVGCPRDWNGCFLIPLYHPGPRACIHRPLVKQLTDYVTLGNMIRKSLYISTNG